MCRALWLHVRPLAKNAGHVIATLLQNYLPTSVLTFAYTIMGMFPQLKKSRSWADMLLHTQKEAAKQESAGAIPMSADQLKKVLKWSKNKDVRATCLLVWSTASRYGDIQHMKVAKTEKVNKTWSRIGVRLPVWERSGRRKLSGCEPTR